MKTRHLIMAAALAAAMPITAGASGMLIPKDTSVPPLAIKHQRVDIQVKNGVATTRLEQVFKNSVNRDLEAVYVFPLPENAAIGDFAMYINGKRVSGELVEKDKARKIYQDIVRRMKDPGLLEHMGGNLFRVSVYPVPRNGEQRIEITYSQTLAFDGGLYKYVYPLRTSDRASRTLEDFSVRARISSATPIKNVYSPSHKVGITRKGEHDAVVGLEEDQSLLDKDFVLYYGVSRKDFGLNLLTHARKGEDGFFMMLISPSVVSKKTDLVARDITFVFDSSGSMMGDKIKQARGALQYCIQKLNDGDRFNVVRFSTDVEMLSDEFLASNDDNRQKALKFVSSIEARGGTDINSALSSALGQATDKNRPHVVVFLTDGKPTIGETETDTILANIDKLDLTQTRVFVFGVGAKLNTHLLDRVSGDNGGVSEYVKPDEDIEVSVSRFSDKISYPVLSQPVLHVDKLKVKMQYPQKLSDLFAGSQITIFGRYQGGGDVAIRLTGEVNGKKREFVYEGSFPKSSDNNESLPRLWATRRVGYLLNEIRLHGEEKELRDEVVRLGTEHGIMTPYTSYLVLENEQAYKQHGIRRKRDSLASRPQPKTVRRESSWANDSEARRGGKKAGEDRLSVAAVPMFGRSQSVGGQAMEEQPASRPRMAKDGAAAVRVSEAIRAYSEAESAADEDTAVIRRVGRKIFYLIDGVWTDRDYDEKMKSTRVKYASDEFFKLLAAKPELKKYFALGEKVIVCVDGKNAIIVE